ncbi:MAG: hypothetical protein Kow0063_12670 [Anaerolineae bacterium]
MIALSAGVLVLSGAAGCVFSPGAAVDGYASAYVETWYDADGDGERDPDESPLPWVTARMAYQQTITDSSGRGALTVFKPGCARRCWKGESVLVEVPPGYQATTPLEINLTGPEDTYAFGFHLEGGTQPPTFPGQPDWAKAFINRGLDLLDFEYDVGEDRLAVALEAGDALEQDAAYGDIFDVILTLKGVEGIAVERVQITSLPSGPVAVCDMSQVEGWLGKMRPAEIVSTYCQTSGLSTTAFITTQANRPAPAR